MAAAGRLSKNNKSPPPHSGWRLKKHCDGRVKSDDRAFMEL